MAENANGIHLLFEQAKPNKKNKLQPPRICEGCGRTFNPKRSDRLRFCSVDCAFSNLSKWKTPTPRYACYPRTPKRCVGCASFLFKKFIRYCDQCRAQREYKPKGKLTKSCVSCGISVTGRSSMLRCKHCARERQKFLHKSSGKKAAARLARKVQQRAVSVEVVNPLIVLERDKWRCQLCGVGTPKRLRGSYNDRAPEVDHIVPLSKGGEHSYCNVQCACRRCNLLKLDRPYGQMRLFG